MKTVQVHRVFAIWSLFWCCVFACDVISAEQTCSFSLHRNKPLLIRLNELFDRDSKTNIVEYNVRIRNDEGGFDLLKGSNPDFFQPWKWYRTQGKGSSHLLLSSDFYFGFLKTLLWFGIEEVDLDLDVQPAECLQGAENKTMDNLIKYLLKDLCIGDHSPHWATVHSENVEICTALIDGYNGKGKLVYRCWSYNAEKQIIYDDDSADDWAFALNVVILILSCLLVVFFYVKFGIHNNIGGKNIQESNNYILEHTYSFLLYHKGTENTADIKCVPSYVLDSMPNLKAKLDPAKGNFVVNVRKTSVTMTRNQLLGEDDRDKKPTWKRFFVISLIMSMLFAPCIPLYCFMWWYHGTLFLVSVSVMSVFTMIVQANFWASIIQGLVTLPIYVINYYHEYFRPHNAFKSKLLKLFQNEPRLNTENTVSAITNESLDNALRRLGIDKNDEQWSAQNIEFEIMSKHLQLKCKRPFLFLSEDGVPLITRDFLERCLKWDCQCPKEKCPKPDCCKQKCKRICLKVLHVLEVVLPIFLALTFIVLVVIMVKAYSDMYYISPSNRFFFSFITSLGPLFVQNFIKTTSSQGKDGKLDRRFHAELMKRINNYDEHLAVNDFTDFDVAALQNEATDITPKLKYDIPDSGQECPLLLHQCCPC